MQSEELVAWRKRNGYDQQALMHELGIRSRQTISSWENSKRTIPRTVELALIALERFPQCRNIGGKRATAHERGAFYDRAGGQM